MLNFLCFRILNKAAFCTYIRSILNFADIRIPLVARINHGDCGNRLNVVFCCNRSCYFIAASSAYTDFFALCYAAVLVAYGRFAKIKSGHIVSRRIHNVFFDFKVVTDCTSVRVITLFHAGCGNIFNKIKGMGINCSFLNMLRISPANATLKSVRNMRNCLCYGFPFAPYVTFLNIFAFL